jgi:hypothetical protein
MRDEQQNFAVKWWKGSERLFDAAFQLPDNR